MLPTYCCAMAYHALAGRKFIPQWFRPAPDEQLVFFTFVLAYHRWARATVWN